MSARSAISDIYEWTLDPESSLNKHFLTLFSIAYGLQAGEVFEFGAGRSSLVLLEAIRPAGGRLTSCDVEPLDRLAARIPGLRDAGRQSEWTFLQCPSREALSRVTSRSFDLVLHDGSHEREEVAEDLAAVLPRVKQFGLVLIHDVEQHQFGAAMRQGVAEGIRRSGRQVSVTSLPYSDGLAIIRLECDAGKGSLKTTWRKSSTLPAVPASFPWGRKEQSTAPVRRGAPSSGVDKAIARVDAAFEATESGGRTLPDEVVSIPGMTSPLIRHLLNHICADPSCRYLEIGCHRGATLIAASHGNPGQFAGIDNFSEFADAGTREELAGHLARLASPNQVRFINANCWEMAPSWPPSSVNVFFYDGRHKQEDHRRAVAAFAPTFERVAVLVVDDWNEECVRQGTKAGLLDSGLQVHHEWERRTTFNGDVGTWWNGFYVAVVEQGDGRRS